MPNYYAIMDQGDGVWGVRIPDLPGCHGAGDTPGQARDDAVSAAREWAAHQIDNGRALPAPSPLAELVRAEVQANEIVLEIPVLVDTGRPVRANISLDAGLLASIDHAAKARGLTRSAFIASAAREKISAEG